MTGLSYGDEGPIAALATSQAESALAILRTSGPEAINLVSSIFSRPKALLSAVGNSLVHGWIQDETGAKIDEVLVSVFRNPRSYTGEDALDITCHGGFTASRAILASLLRVGFRSALPGEFTLRAFLNGKIDLTRSESVMEIVSAKTDEARSRAVGRLSGALEQEIREVKETLLGVLAATELFLDYSEDDGIGPADEADGILPERERVEAARESLEQLAASYRREKLFKDGATIAVAGRPNAGKSSLFNRLLREERSIVSPTPGTTRDWIESWISIEGIPLRLVDTAGLRATEDPIEKVGVDRSLGILEEADIILYVIDASEGLDGEDRSFLDAERGIPLIPVWNKVDMAPQEFPEEYREKQPVLVSSVTGTGIEELASRIVKELERSMGSSMGTEPLPLKASPSVMKVGIASERQKALIDTALRATNEVLGLADTRRPLDLIAPALREAVDALGEITGDVSTADILETMFSRFCVGK